MRKTRSGLLAVAVVSVGALALTACGGSSGGGGSSSGGTATKGGTSYYLSNAEQFA